MKQKQNKQTVHTPADREQRAREWADRIPDGEESVSGPVRETYRDGSLITECWADKTGAGD